MRLDNGQPNILLFMPDQMQAMVTLSSHPCRMPNVERLAREGVSFYAGKYHISASETPKDRGWEELFYNEQQSDHGQRRLKYMESDVIDPATRGRGEIVRPGWMKYRLYGTNKRSYEQTNDYACVQKAINKLDDLKNSSEPWCMYIGPNGPHDPFVIPEKYAALYNPNDIELPPNYYDEMKDKPRIYQRMRAVFDQLTAQEVKESIAYYWGYCTMVDDLFGEVMDTLERNGQMNNTIIMFVSDHGEHAGAHGLYCKGISMFDEGYRVPLVIRAPFLAKQPGITVEEFVTLMDVAPTLLEVSGSKPLSKCSGSSLVPFLKGEKPDIWRDSFYAQCNGTELYYTSRMVKTKKYKFVYNPTDFDELYDLELDPHEMVNIADQPNMSTVLKEMYKKMWENAFQSEDTNFVTYIPTATGQYGPSIVNE
jgi:arylsulfatase A-like enzyme